jgi:hypothetical protein
MSQIKINNTDNKWSFYYNTKRKGSSKHITVTYKILLLNEIHKINNSIILSRLTHFQKKKVNVIIPLVIVLWG